MSRGNPTKEREMTTNIDKETERLIEMKILERFNTHKEEDVKEALYAVADELRASGRDDITDQAVRRVFTKVMMF